MKDFEVTSGLLFKYFSGEASEQEAEAIIKWLDASQVNRDEFVKSKKNYIETTHHFLNAEETSKQKFKEFESYIESKEAIKEKKSALHLVNRLIRYAAVFLLLTGFSLASYFLGRSNKNMDNDNDFYVVNVPYGGRSNLTLPDGSTVDLNAGSTLKYSKMYGINSRELYLEGEGLFKVEKHKFPMVLHTSHIDINVLGTVFNVKSYKDENNIETTLLEGSIRVETPDKPANPPIFLEPNEKLVFNKTELKSVKNNNIQNAGDKEEKTTKAGKEETLHHDLYKISSNVDVYPSVSWKEGKYILSGETLENLSIILTRKFDVTFSFENEDVKKHVYSGTIGDYPLEQVLEALTLTSPVIYTIKEKHVTLALDMKKSRAYNKLINN